MAMKAARSAVLWIAAISGFVVAVGYLSSGYIIGFLYGGAMKAHRAAELRQIKTASPPKPDGWANDTVFLGVWQGESRAGSAVIDRLTVEPNRLHWGNAANGICESEYSVETMPPPEPTDRVTAVVRLTLQPVPCSTGDAVIQLSKPLDGRGVLSVNTYNAKGELIGQYGDFIAVPR